MYLSMFNKSNQKTCMKFIEDHCKDIKAIKLYSPICDSFAACLYTLVVMSVVPHGMLAVRKVRQNEERIKKEAQTFKNQSPQYSSKYMNSIWGMYNRYSVHNLKKNIDPSVFAFMGQPKDSIVAPNIMSVEKSTDFKSLTSSAQSLLTNYHFI